MTDLVKKVFNNLYEKLWEDPETRREIIKQVPKLIMIFLGYKIIREIGKGLKKLMELVDEEGRKKNVSEILVEMGFTDLEALKLELKLSKHEKNVLKNCAPTQGLSLKMTIKLFETSNAITCPIFFLNLVVEKSFLYVDVLRVS